MFYTLLSLVCVLVKDLLITRSILELEENTTVSRRESLIAIWLSFLRVEASQTKMFGNPSTLPSLVKARRNRPFGDNFNWKILSFPSLSKR